MITVGVRGISYKVKYKFLLKILGIVQLVMFKHGV